MIVDKPKRGDVMCITKYRKENGDLLEADKQKVIWIDGLSIEPTQLSSELEPVGICIVVKGNKAIVRYRKIGYERWLASGRFGVPESSIMNDGAEHTCTIQINGWSLPNKFVFTASSRAEFVDKLNTWFLGNSSKYSAELVELDTDLPAIDTSDTKDGDSYRNRIIINARIDDQDRSFPIFTIEEIPSDGYRGYYPIFIAKHINAVDWYYKNNGFKARKTGGCCRARYYDMIQYNQTAPTGPMTSIDSVPGGIWNPGPPRLQGLCPVRKVDFTDNEYCQILRDNFATYDEYLESMLVKFPCGAGGATGEFPSGKENTYKLADCTFLNNANGEQEVLYPAANWVASIDLNAPKLGKGNWWLPSAAEMCEIMRDITYNTSFWETNPDIINRVINKFRSIDIYSWDGIITYGRFWTSTKYEYRQFSGSEEYSAYFYDGGTGVLNFERPVFFSDPVMPITIYEF